MKKHLLSPFTEQLGCGFEEGAMGLVIKINDMKEASIEDLFAAGDVSNPMQNATFASASAVMAGVSAHF